MEFNNINISNEIQTAQLINSEHPEVNQEADLRIRKYAMNALSCGECLSWAKYAKYIPGAPKALKHPSLPWIGDGCRVIKTGLLIEEKVRHILSENATLDEKFEDAFQIVDLTLKLSNTKFVECLPDTMKKRFQEAGKVCNIARLGYDVKKKVGHASQEESSLGRARDVLDATRSAAWTATAFLDLVGPEKFFTLKTSLKVGSFALAPAIGGLSAAKFAGDLLSPAKKETPEAA